MNDEPKLFYSPVFSSDVGDLSVIDESNVLPFKMKRIFYIYNNPIGSKRGCHAHISLKQFICCLSGKIEVFNISVNGKKTSFLLDQPNKGLYIPQKTWSYQINLSPNSIYFVICSDFYLEKDYIKDYKEFEKLIINR